MPALSARVTRASPSASRRSPWSYRAVTAGKASRSGSGAFERQPPHRNARSGAPIPHAYCPSSSRREGRTTLTPRHMRTIHPVHRGACQGRSRARASRPLAAGHGPAATSRALHRMRTAALLQFSVVGKLPGCQSRMGHARQPIELLNSGLELLSRRFDPLANGSGSINHNVTPLE